MIGLVVCNSIAVGFFGMILSAAFCDIYWTTQKRLLMVGYMVVLMLFQGIIFVYAGAEMVRIVYPLIMHVPLAMILGVLSEKRLWPVIAVLTTYLCCQLRRWLALLIVALVHGGNMMQDIVEVIITIPLLLFLLKFIAPSVRSISHYALTEQGQFGVIPLLGYGFDYLTRIYTNWLQEGTPVVVEFMFFICSAVYLVMVLHSSREERERNQMEQMQEYLNLQVAQSVREIENLRRSQEKASIYRHDLRHHMLYLSSCIENGCNEQAMEYMKEICAEIDANKVVIFSENEAVNLILSAFAGKAEESGIPIEINVAISPKISVAENDLCVLLSNALENALHECQRLKAEGIDGRIEVAGFEKNKKIFFEVSNTCGKNVQIVKGIPFTQEPGHGIGVRSICAIVDKYGGMYSFFAKDGRFVLRVSL